MRECFDIPATAVGIIAPFFAWKYPVWGNSDRGLLLVNALYWMIPCGVAWLYLGIRMLVSPYLVYKEAGTKRLSDAQKLEDQRIAFESQIHTEKTSSVHASEIAAVKLAAKQSECDSLIRDIANLQALLSFKDATGAEQQEEKL